MFLVYGSILRFPNSNQKLPGNYVCKNCGKSYRWYSGLHRHVSYECGKPPRFRCPHCPYLAKHRSHIYCHIKNTHAENAVYALDVNNQQ